MYHDLNWRTSSGKHSGNKLQLGQRATNSPESGGGGVSRAATWNACAMAALVLARNCGVKATSTRRRRPYVVDVTMRDKRLARLPFL